MGTVARGAGAILLLIASNTFMNAAWYLHLKVKSWPMVAAIFISWGIAFFEYCLQVPANRLGHFSQGGPFTAPQLKVIQEGISLSTFAIFSVLVLKEKLSWRDGVAFVLIFGGVAVGLSKPGARSSEEAPAPELALPPMPVAPAPEGDIEAKPQSALAPEVSGEGRRLLQQSADGAGGGGGKGSGGGGRSIMAMSDGRQPDSLGRLSAASTSSTASVASRGSGSGSLAASQQQPGHLQGMERGPSSVVLVAGDAEVQAGGLLGGELRRRDHNQGSEPAGEAAAAGEDQQQGVPPGRASGRKELA